MFLAEVKQGNSLPSESSASRLQANVLLMVYFVPRFFVFLCFVVVISLLKMALKHSA